MKKRLFSKTLLPRGAATSTGPGPPHYRGFTMTDTTLWVGLLWTSDQPNAETFASQQTIFTETYSCPRRDSKPQIQQALDRAPLDQQPKTLRNFN